MSDTVAAFGQVMFIVVASTASLLGIGIGAWKLAHLGSRSKSVAAPRVDESRLDRLEAAVDAIAVEVERISESQRFTVNLLSERLPPARQVDRIAELSPPAPKRTTTPH